MSPAAKLYEGKAKILYTTDDPNVLLTHFKDDATAFNAQKRGQIHRKGEINCQISVALLNLLEHQGIPTHYIDQPQPDQMRVKAVKIIPLEVVVRNLAAGSLSRQTGIAEGTVLSQPLVEFYLKNDELGDPLLTRDRVKLLNVATPSQVQQLETLALAINEHLSAFFDKCQITLVDFKLEFGVDADGSVILADEISPDTCRLWDNTQSDPHGRVMDKDRFRRDLGQVEDAYQRVLARVLEVVNSAK